MKTITHFKVGDVVSWQESGWNQVVAIIGEIHPEEGVSLCATSTTFGCIASDWVWLPLSAKVAKWQSVTPEILVKNL